MSASCPSCGASNLDGARFCGACARSLAPGCAPPGVPVADTGFVGRARELDTLRTRFERACAGSGSIVLLAGEPGIGKTRLAEELAASARMRGAPAFWPWVQVIRAYVRDRDPRGLMDEMGPGAADIGQVVPEVRGRLPDLPFPPRLDPEQARFRLFDSVTTFLKNAAHRQPLLLTLDDLHWADKPSLLLLQFLAQDLGDARLLVVGAYRDVELSPQHPVAETLAGLRRERAHERISLRGLAADEVTELVRAAFARDLDPSGLALARALHQETEGNPFFIKEILRRARARGRHRLRAAPRPRRTVGLP